MKKGWSIAGKLGAKRVEGWEKMIKIPIPLHPYVACRTPDSSQYITDTENGWMQGNMRSRDQVF